MFSFRTIATVTLASTIRRSINFCSPQLGCQLRYQSTVRQSPCGGAYWNKIPQWRDISVDKFISYRWQLGNTVSNIKQLIKFLEQVLPEVLEPSSDPRLKHIKTRYDFIEDARKGLDAAPMAVRLTPHTLSIIDWNNALDDPIRRQFITLRSALRPDHDKLTLDSLHEEADSPVPGLVHRYPDRALFLATSICPTYCRFCTRAYAVGGETLTVGKAPQKPSRKRWEDVFQHVSKTEQIQDIVVSGGDTYYLQPDQIRLIAERFLAMPHIKRIRFASKGLAVAPSRTLDPHDEWTSTFIDVSNQAKDSGKHICLHTHFNHPNEITWITKAAAKHLAQNGVTVRNQSVLLKGVNDDSKTMGELIRSLADIQIWPYYVYMCDMTRGIEDLRTKLEVILKMEQDLCGTIGGIASPKFVVDLPGGGGKRLAATYTSYDTVTGRSTFKTPGLPGDKGKKVYEYWDPYEDVNGQPRHEVSLSMTSMKPVDEDKFV